MSAPVRALRVERARLFGSNGLWILVVGILLLGTHVAALIAKGAKLAPEARLNGLSGLLVGLTIGLIVVAVWKLPSISRDRQLARRYTDGIVLSAVRTPPLASALRDLPSEEAGRHVQLPTLFTVVANKDGVSFFTEVRGGAALRIEWAEVRGIHVGAVEELTRRSNALFFELETQTLPVVVTGAGIAGLFPQSKATLEAIKQQLIQFRTQK